MYAELAPRLFKNGWRNLLPIGVYKDGRAARDTKACFLKGWSKRSVEPLTEEGLAVCVARYSKAGIGCAFGPVHGLVAIDIDVEDHRKSELVRLAAQENLPRTEFMRIGRSPKRLLMYRGQVRSMKPVGTNIEIFGSSGQTVLFAIHPKTGKPYYWPSRSPLDASPADLPQITQEQVQSFLEAVCTLIPPKLPDGYAGGPAGASLDIFQALALERRTHGLAAARDQVRKAGALGRHLVVNSVVGWMLAYGFEGEEILALFETNFAADARTEQFADISKHVEGVIAATKKKFLSPEKDWSL